MAERAGLGDGKDKQGAGDGVKKSELPPEEFKDFLSTYDDTMWQHPDDEK